MLEALPEPQRQIAEVEAELRARHEYQAQLTLYDRELATFQQWSAERGERERRREELAQLIGALPEVEKRLAGQSSLRGSPGDLPARPRRLPPARRGAQRKAGRSRGWRAAKQALADIRLKIKTYLTPSLSRVASMLLLEMTAGQRSKIVVDENFDVVVDGQRLETLSGSTKAVANLALRIGLGQVLTHRVASLFVGDEIDAAMDASRAASLHASIRRLTPRISQVMLVTHKTPDADWLITLPTADAEKIGIFPP